MNDSETVAYNIIIFNMVLSIPRRLHCFGLIIIIIGQRSIHQIVCIDELTTDKCSFNQCIDTEQEREKLGRGKPLKLLGMATTKSTVVGLHIVNRRGLSFKVCFMVSR